MKLRGLAFDNDQSPETVLVEMTIDEAAFLAKAAGSVPSTTYNEMMTNGGMLAHSVYSCLTGYVFNAYWDDGLRDYLNGRSK